MKHVIEVVPTRLGDVSIYELTVADVRNRFRVGEARQASADVAKSSHDIDREWELMFNKFLRIDGVAYDDLRELTSLTDEQLELRPSELATIVSRVKHHNSVFFEAQANLSGVLDSLPKLAPSLITESSASALSETSPL